jgi:hypothetical protein
MRLGVVAAAILLASCTSAGSPTTTDAVTSATGASATSSTTATTTDSTTGSPAFDLSARPMIWFAPHPAVDLPGFVKGSADYFDLFAVGSDWSSAADQVHVFKIYDQIGVAREPTDEELLSVIDGLRDRGLPLAMELGALPPHPGFGPIGAAGECGEGIEGFAGVVAVQTVQRIADLGGSVALVAFDEPLAHGHFYEGENACSWSVERVAEEVANFAAMLREVEPGIVVGDIEPAWVEPEIGADEIARWLDAYEDAAGEPLGFFHLDVDWNRPGWPEVAREIEDVVRSRKVPFGIIYNGGDDTRSDAEWVQLSAERAYTFEQEWGGHPDHVVLQSWHFHPQRVLPEDEPTTFTGLIGRYLGRRTAVEAEVADGVVNGRVVTMEGDPVPKASVAVTAQPLDGAIQTLVIEGVVPEGAQLGEVGIRINTEGAGPGPADMRIYQVGYEEPDEPGNRVPDPDFGYLAQFEIDGVEVVPSDTDAGTMLRLTADPDGVINLGSDRFVVTPGARYRFIVEAAVPEGSAGAGYAGVVFLADEELERTTVPLAPVAEAVGVVTADEEGRFRVALSDLAPGRHRIVASYPGDLSSWPATTTLVVTK